MTKGEVGEVREGNDEGGGGEVREGMTKGEVREGNDEVGGEGGG